MMTLPATTLRLRLVAGIAATAAVTATLMIGPLALRSSAADYTADSEATWRAALVSAMASPDATNTITLTGDFAMSDLTGTWPEYTTVTQDLIIDGGGHTVTSAPGNTSGFLFANNVTGSVTLQNVIIDGFTTQYSAAISVAGTATLDNVTVRNFDGWGSAVYLAAVDVSVVDSTFTDNSAGANGGALYIDCDSSFTIEASTFHGNTSQDSGGAVYAFCDIDIYDSAFTSNAAVVDGGAVFAEGYVDIETSTFTSNSAGGDAGAVNSDQELTTYYTTFVDNHAEDGSGGAIWAQYGAYQDHSTFQGNSAAYSGGGVYVYEGPFEAEESVLADNIAGEYGGGAYGYSYANSFSTTWSGNEAAYGGALYSEGNDDYTAIEESTFVGNVASDYGGAVYVYDSWVGTYNSVFSGNEAGGDGAHIYVDYYDLVPYATVFADAVGSSGCYADAGVYSTGYSFDDDGSCTDGWADSTDFGFDGEDPMLGPLADNGGPTQTRQPLPGSPLIDAIPWGDCSDYSQSPNDQRGVNRSSTGASDFGCDIGSVEVIPDLSFDLVGASGTTTVTVAGALNYDCEAWTPITGYLPAPPAGVSFPHGVVSYCLYVPFDGWTASVTLDLPSPVNALWKETAGVWSEVPGAVFAGTTVTYSVTDGGALDADGTADSYIIDPVGPGLRGAFTG
jgi:predicted outer membrane repeat protein